MATPRHRLFLAASITGTGVAPAATHWPDRDPFRFARWEHFLSLAETAQRGVLDAVFLSDFPAHHADPVRGGGHVLDPLVLLAAIAGAVPDVGFVLTASSSYNAPYNLARRAATLDEISGGRTILNLVTNFAPAVAANFGAAEQLPREDRYRKAGEFADVLTALWSSWKLSEAPDEAGRLWGEDTGLPIDHHGEFFDVAGPLNVPVGPQGHPVLAQAGASGPGLDFAAAHAEMVYAATLTPEAAREFRDDLERRVVAAGRRVEEVRLVPGVNVILGDDEADARRRHERLFDAADETALIERFLASQRSWGQQPIPGDVDHDAPLDPAWFAPDPHQNKPIGFSLALQRVIADEGLTARQVVRRYGEPGGHRLLVGSPEQVAEGLLAWWADGLVDGYVVHLPLLPDDLGRFVDEVVPILQKEGAFPADYVSSGRTMRDRLGLARP